MFAKQVKHNSLHIQKQHKSVLHLPVKAPVDEIIPQPGCPQVPREFPLQLSEFNAIVA